MDKKVYPPYFPSDSFETRKRQHLAPAEKWYLNWLVLMIPTFLPATRFSAWACLPDQLARDLSSLGIGHCFPQLQPCSLHRLQFLGVLRGEVVLLL